MVQGLGFRESKRKASVGKGSIVPLELIEYGYIGI